MHAVHQLSSVHVQVPMCSLMVSRISAIFGAHEAYVTLASALDSAATHHAALYLPVSGRDPGAAASDEFVSAGARMMSCPPRCEVPSRWKKTRCLERSRPSFCLGPDARQLHGQALVAVNGCQRAQRSGGALAHQGVNWSVARAITVSEQCSEPLQRSQLRKSIHEAAGPGASCASRCGNASMRRVVAASMP